MSSDIVIRPVARDDFTGWNTLWAGYNAFYGRKDSSSLTEDVTRTTWTRFFDTGEPMHALVAESAGELLGLAHFLYHRSTIQHGLSCYMQDLFTVETARGKGVGRALIEEVYGQARMAGAERVYWQTHEKNSTAMQLYDKVATRSGFVVYRKSI